MAKELFINNASSLLAASIDDDDTTIQVDAGQGALFPSPSGGDWFVITLENDAGDVERCKVTSRTTDLLTVVRGFDNSTAQAWTNGVTRVEMRNHAGAMEQMIQRTGDTMEGDLDMDGHSIVDAVLEGETVIEPGATIKGATITNSSGSMGNALTIPEDGTSPPEVGGSAVLTEQSFDPASVFAAGMVMMFYGDAGDIPDGWALCDGNNGRPDLRNKFIVGVGSDYSIGDIGGAAMHTGVLTAAAGAHDHGGATGGHELTEAEMAPHYHFIAVNSTNGSDGHSAISNTISAWRAEGNGDDEYNLRGAGGTPTAGPTNSSGDGDAHTHSISSASSHQHSLADVDNRPPYYALYFIIKVDPAGDYGGIGGGGGGDGSMYDMYNEDGCTTHIGGRSTLMDDLAISGGNVQINCCASNVFRLTLTASVTMLAPNNPLSGQVINIIVKQANGGGFNITWSSAFKWPDGSPPTITATNGAVDIITCQFDSSTGFWYCSRTANYV